MPLLKIATLFLVLLLSFPAWADQGEAQRYQFYQGAETPLFLLDSKTGAVWRAVYCEGTQTLGCWQATGYPDKITPWGLDAILKQPKPITTK